MTEFTASREAINDRADRYLLFSNGSTVTYRQALSWWQDKPGFTGCFTATLMDSPFQTLRWETPPITSDTVDQPFEYVLLDSPWLDSAPDTRTCSVHFIGADVVTFPNLGADAMLVVPTPLNEDSAYTHLSAFLRSAPTTQINHLWRTLGIETQARLCDEPLWISTAGGGVAWLHIRLDSYPKYYGHTPYKSMMGSD
jgi:hypothetical protein